MNSIPIPNARNNLQEISGSPALAASAYKVLKEEETTGVPLNTSWTFWIDKYVIIFKIIHYFFEC